MATVTATAIAAFLAGLIIGAGLVFMRLRRVAHERQAGNRRLHELEAERQSQEARYRELQRSFDVLQEKLDQAQRQASLVAAEKARLEERGKNQEEKLTWLEEARSKLSKEFEALASKIFEERGKQIREQGKSNLDEVLKPFREQLKEFRQRVDQVHTEGTQHHASLKQQLEGLRDLNLNMQQDARNLTRALRGESKTQGNWGEMILERVLESSGLKKGREYETQLSFKDADNRRRLPDAIVHLPEERDVIIDSKVSLVAYERFCAAEEEDERRKALDDHLISMRNHIQGLNRKEYEGLEGLRTLDFVLLFIPVEAAFLTAMEHDPGLYTDAYEKNIVLVSPTTLLVTLRTIHNIWRYEYQNRNALDIADRAGKICDQIARIEGSLKKLGERLEQASAEWQTTYGRLSSGQGNLLRQAHMLQDLGAKARKALPEPRDTIEEEDEESAD